MSNNNLLTQYDTRKNEIDCMLSYLSQQYSINDIDSSSTTSKSITDIQKSTIILMLYNLLESTVSLSFQSILDDIQDNNISYERVSTQFKEVWLDLRYSDVYDKSASYETYRKRTHDIVDKVIDDKDTALSFSSANSTWQLPGGNMDLKEITSLCKKFGIRFYLSPEVSRNGGILKNIKDKRNQLAHGDFSFEEIGNKITINDLIIWKKEVTSFLGEFTTLINKFIQQQAYRKKIVS